MISNPKRVEPTIVVVTMKDIVSTLDDMMDVFDLIGVDGEKINNMICRRLYHKAQGVREGALEVVPSIEERDSQIKIR